MVLAGSQAPGQFPVNGAVCGRGAEVIHDSTAQLTTSWRKRIRGGLLFYLIIFFILYFCPGALQLRAMPKRKVVCHRKWVTLVMGGNYAH